MTIKYRQLLISILGFIFIIPWSVCFGKLYPVYIKDYDRLTKAILERMADDKMVAAQPNGNVIIRDETNSPIVFFTDPGGNSFQFFKFRNMYPASDSFIFSGFGDYGEGNDEYKMPNDISTCDEGTRLIDLYIVDTGNDRITRGIFDLYYFAISPQTPIGDDIGLNNPLGLGVYKTASFPKIYVADSKNHRLVRLSAFGELEQEYGSYGSGMGQFNTPFDIVRSGDFVYIADTYNDRIVALLEHPDGTYEWWSTYDLPQQYTLVTSIDCDQNGNIYAVDKTYCKIIKLSEGLEELLWSIGTRGIGTNQYQSPRSISVSKSCSDVIVIESYTEHTGIRFLENRIDIFDVVISPSVFDATIEETQISFKIDDVARVSVEILYEDEHVRWMIQDLMLPAGTHDESFLIWDGRDDAENLCLPGIYEVKITATDAYDYAAVSVTPFTVKGTRVPAILTQDAHWTEEGEPYVLTSDVNISTSCKLTIDPGVKVMPTGNYVLKIAASPANNGIFAYGTPINKILFTPHRKLYPEPDPVAQGFWKGLYFDGMYWYSPFDDTLVLEHCIIECAGSDTAAIQVRDYGQVIMKHCEILKSGSHGYYENYVRISRDIPATKIDSCLFKDNDSIPIRVAFSSLCEVVANSYEDNVVEAIEVGASKRKQSGVLTNPGIPYWCIPERYDGPDFNFVIDGGTSDSCITLIIEPGTQLFFDDSTALLVGAGISDSRIIAQATENDSIIFAALDTIPGWSGIDITSDSLSQFEFCRISYGGEYVAGRKASLTALMHRPLEVKNSTISKSKGVGIHCAQGVPYGDVEIGSIIEENTFYANDSFHVKLPINDLRNLTNNNFIEHAICVYGANDIITESFTLDYQGAPLIIANNFIIGTGTDTVVVTLNQENRLEFMGNQQMKIGAHGGIKAHGVTFTNYTASAWSGIYFDTNSLSDSCCLDSCIIEEQDGASGGVYITHNSSPTITDCNIVNNKHGIMLGNNASNANPTIEGNLISLNECGIYNTLYGSQILSVHNNDIYGNEIAVKNECTGLPVVDADSNWWGHASGPWDPSEGPPDYNPAGQGDSIGDYVLYRPWLESPVHPEVITLIQPNGGETLYSGDEYEIQWSCSVTPVRQELYYTTDYPEAGLRNEPLWIFIDTVATGQTQYLWQVPGVASEQCRMAVKVYYEIEGTGDKETWGYKKTEVMKLRGYEDEITRNDNQKGLSNEYKSRNTNTMIAVDISDANFSIILNEYTLSIFTNGAGSVTKDPDLLLYPHGTSVVLTAIQDPEDPLDPEPEWIFDSWTGDLESSENPDTLVMDSDKSVMATFSYVLNLADFPMYEADEPYHEMCGPANGQMTLNYMWWNRNTHPDSAPMLFDNQAALYDTGIAHNATPGLDFFDLNGMWYIVQHYKPNPYTQYGYNFTKRQNTDSTVLLKQICQWIDYCVGELSGGHEPGHPMHVPGIIPAYGNYTNWMAVRGFRADTIAYQMPDTLEIYGFWMNDPYPEILGGIGENSYKTVVQFLNDYYDPLSTGDQWNGKYVAICEPPEDCAGCALILAQPTPQFTIEQTHQLKLTNKQYDLSITIKEWIIQAAINGVYDQLIPYDEHFKAVFQITTPGDPFFVKGIDNNDYYAVPFNFNFPVIGDFGQKKKTVAENISQTKSIERTGLSEVVKNLNESLLPVVEPTLIVILIDAQDGHFKEASWIQTPVKYLPLTQQEAQNMLPDVLEELGLEISALSKFYPELIHRKSSPYYPEWRFIVDEYEIYISQDGSVLVEMPGDDSRGDGGVMSDGETYVYSLATAVPTPFTKSTMISYSIAQPGHVSLKVYDVSGRLVRILVDEKKNVGVYNIVWNGNDENNNKIAPGIYFTEFTSREFTSVKKVILVK